MVDMRRALSERPVKCTSVCIYEVDKVKIILEMNKMDGYSGQEEKGIRAWRSYGNTGIGFLFSPCRKQKKAISTLRNQAQSKGSISGGKRS